MPRNKQDGITSGLGNIREKCLQQQVINIYNLFFVSNAFHPPVIFITEQWKIIDSLAMLLQNKLIKPFLALLLQRSHFHLPFVFPYSLIQCSFFPPRLTLIISMSGSLDHTFSRVLSLDRERRRRASLVCLSSRSKDINQHLAALVVLA